MKRYIVGIDLGTTNSALAYVDASDAQRTVNQFLVPQVVAEGMVAERPTLPSFLYLGGEHDVAPGSLALPWDRMRTYAVGEFARVQGARVPGRLISSAKSYSPICLKNLRSLSCSLFSHGSPKRTPRRIRLFRLGCPGS